MQLVEYVNSLFEQGLSGEEVIAKTQEWKKKNNYGVSEQEPTSVLKEDLKPKEEEVKIDDVADKKDATVTSTSDASKAVEKITGQSKFGTGPLALPDPNQSFGLVGRTAKQVSGIMPIFEGVDLNPGETKTANKFDFKYEIGEDKQPIFYTKKEGEEDWINVTANKAKNPDAELGAAEELGFNVGDFDREKALKRKKIKKDFEIGDVLSKAKLEAPKPYVEKAGKFLTIEEIEAAKKARKARVAIGVEELDLDTKISDSIYENNLDVDNFYSQFKNKEYSGKYVKDLGPNIYTKTFEDFNPDKINNFTSSDEFLGFLQQKGYMQDYIDTVYGPGLTLAEGDDIQNFKIGKQRKLDNYFKLYIQEANSKYTNQVLLSYIVKNKEKFKNVKSLSEAYDIAKKHFEKEYGQSTFEAVSYNDYNSYREEQFPELVSTEKKLQAAKKAKSEELIKEGSSEGLLQDGFNKFYDGVISRATEQSYELREALGFDMGYATLLDTEENIKKSAEDVRYGYIEGKKAEVNNVEYIKDSNGSIYNVTNKVVFVPSNAQEFEKVNKAIEESDQTGSSFSAAGSTEQFLATSGTMLFDIASIYSLGKFTKATKLGKITNAIKIPKASFDTMSYYTFAGYVSSKKNIYNELINKGVNETEAREIAVEGARIAGVWSGASSLIAPVPTYLKQFDKILGNRSILQSAIRGYRKNGPTGFINNFKETLKNIKITKDGVIKTGIAGIQEFGQEQIQQYGEITGVNSYVNKLLGRDVLNEIYSRQDFVNTGIVSFASGSAFANLNIAGFKPSAAQQLNNLYLLGKDTTQTQKLLNEMVAEGKATQEEAGKVMSGIRSVKNQMSRIPANVSAETKLESARLQQDIADLQAKKSRTDEVYHDSIDSQIDAKKKELAEIVKPELEKMAARKGAKKAAEQLGAGFENFSTQQDMDSAAESLTEDGWEVQDSTGYGMALTKGKQKIILVNDQAAAEDNRYTTDQHEVLHPFWEAALKANPEAAISLGKALMVEIINNKDINAGTELLSRFSGYLSDENYSAENTWEEVIPLVSEALSNGDITYNKKQEAWWKNLGTKISNFLKGNKKPLSLQFNTGKDVFEFIKGYNKTIEAGKGLTKEQLEVAEKGAKGKLIEEGFDQESTYTVKEGETIQDVADKFNTTVQNLKDLNKTSGVDLKAGDNLIVDRGVKIVERASEIKAAQQIKESVAKESKRIEDSQEVQRLYDDQGVSAAFDIIQKFKPITSRIVESRSQAPNFDRELLTDEIETGPRGILDLITEYNPESGVPLAAYINKFLPARAIEASKRVLGEEFTTDVTEARGVVAEETTAVETKEKPLAKKPTETVEFSQAQVEKIGAKNKAEVETKITEATKDSFKGKKITRFGETRNVPKAVADIYAGMFGLNPQTITDKTRNYQKTDAEGLTTAKQFLLKNANNDFARLPKTKDGFGKGTFLPRNVMNALYTDGKLTGTLKDYMDLIRQKPVKPIYRDAVGQTIRGLLNLHIRNRMFEDLVTTTPERLRGGAKFSKRINTEQQVFEDKQLNDLFKSVSQAKSIIDVAKIIGVKGKITVNDSNRAQKQEQMLDFIKSGSIPSAVFEMAKFQNFARRKVNGVYVDLPARGGLYYGKSDPAYQTALNAAKENDSKYPDLAKPKRVNVNKAFTKEGIKQSKENTKFLNSFVNILNDAVNKNGLPIEIAALYVTSGYQATTGIIKIAAPFRYKSTKFEYAGPGGKGSDNKGEKFREEHTIPASVIGANIILAIQKNAVKPTMKAIEKNYFQVQLSKKDDTKLDKAGLDSTLFENQTIFDSPISRLAAAGINLQTIINPLNGKTIAEENEVGINSKIYNSLSLDGKAQASAIQNEQIKKGALDENYNVKKAIDLLIPLSENKAKASKRNSDTQPSSLQEEFVPVDKSIENLEVLDNALNQARRPDAPVKKIRVFDFDDTLARSKSKVLYTVPNVEGGFSEGSTKLKAIFMVGGPGAGKTNVGKGLQLGRRGYKVVNQDIALEAMKAEAGLPAKESDYTAEQRSTRSKLGAAARKAAVAKFDKYAAAGNGMVIDGTGASYNATTKKIKALQDAGFEVHMVVATTPLETAIERNRARTERSLPDFVVKKTYESVQESLKRYREDFGDRLYEINTETIEYGKSLPNDFLQQVYAGINANKVNKIDATEFAAQASTLESQGAEFDFREFSKVVDGKKGPLFSVAEKIAKARGTDDIFILTARPADAAGPIQEFMKANGIDLKLENIVGLGDGTAAAKGRWIASKAAEGYNDFYFADDAVKNVQAVKDVLSQVDVKSKVQQAKASKRITFDKVFNDIIEAKTGIESYKQFSAAKAKTVGASKGKFTFFTTPSAEDFLGLLYKTLSKGKVGDAQMAFYKENLIDPYNRAEMAISQAKVAAGRDYKALKKQFKNIPKTLEKETGIAKYTYQHAIRTYIWDSQGIEVPGLSKRDQKRLTDFIKADPELQAFADQLVTIQKGKPYPKPDKDWTAGNITTDVISGINKVNRAEYLQEWQENVDIIFSEKNMNKLEAAFGAKYVEALKDSLRAMKSGSNRPLGGDRVSNQILDWLNNSVGAIMFLNTRSAILQTISAVNFINWGDNNILKAGKAFANQKQFWSDFLTLMNSDYLLERRDGLKINVSESEIADAVEGSKNKVNAAISYLLNKGFVFTRYADSFAIASGGATFYRNRIESLVEQGMDRKLAEQQAFEDFRLIAEENQQSSSPMRISQQQRSLIGRIILQFGNTQLQYVRIQKRDLQDLIAGRGDPKVKISRIVYYGAIQNLLFNALQSGLAWALFDDDEDDDEEKAELTKKNKEQKLQRALNGAIDSQLKGLGIQGAVVAGVKNALMTIAEQADKKSPKFEEALDDLLSIAPALGSKIRKLKSAARTVSWNRKEIKEKGFSMDNPAYLAGAQTISAVFNIPLDRAVMKMNSMRNILNPATENWQKVALALGWSTWDVGLPYFGLAEDKPVLTETEKQTKKLFDLNKSDQVKMLLDLGLTKKQIRALTKEEQRVKEIIKLQNKNKDGKNKS
jgi:chloramphenicol 3-O-phosphotransferase